MLQRNDTITDCRAQPTAEFESAGERAARAWLSSGTPNAKPALYTTPELSFAPAGNDDPLPEFERWTVGVIAGLSAKLASLQDAAEIAAVSADVNLAIADQLAALHLGQVFTFSQQCDGQLIQDLIPRVGRENENSNSGRVVLGMHSDDAVLSDPYRVDNLVLVGVNNPDAVPTHIIPVDAIVARLDLSSLSLLTQPRYTFGCPEAFTLGHRNTVRSPNRAILRSTDRGYEIRFAIYSTLARHGDSQAACALGALRQAVTDAGPETVVLRGGDMVTFSNGRYLHARGAVGGRRWIKRVYLKRELRDLVARCSTPRSRVFDLEPAIDASVAPAEAA